MTIGEFKKKDLVYVDNAVQGMRTLSHSVVTMEEEEAASFFISQWEARGRRGVWADFYYFRLEPEERERVDAVLSEEERAWIREQEKEVLQSPRPRDEVVFEADETLLKMAARLNAGEMLFCTVYMDGEGPDGQAAAWWGNYGRQYVVFRKTQAAGK